MNRLDLILRVRSLTRDFSNSIFREIDIIDYLNEGVMRCRQAVRELKGMQVLTSGGQIPTPLPEEYHHLLALYSASRCYAQDERHYQATNFMNEFEAKMEELKIAIQSGEVAITDENNTPVEVTYSDEYVRDNYFDATGDYDVDDGVEGVE